MNDLAEVLLDLAMNNLPSPLMHPIRKDSRCLAMGHYHYNVTDLSTLLITHGGASHRSDGEIATFQLL